MTESHPKEPASCSIEALARVLVEHDLSEIECEENGRRIYLSRQVARAEIAPVPAPASSSVSVAAPSASSGAADRTQHPGVVRSPMVGTVYTASEPGAAPFVRVGDSVKPGQTLLIIEAMKVLNPIKASKAGKVIDVFVFDQKPVEYDEPLLVIE